MPFFAMISLVVVLLAGCAGSDREMPKNSGAATDEMKLSPCACLEIEYDGRGYEWRS